MALGKERAAAAGDPAGLEPLYIRRTGPEAARLDFVPTATTAVRSRGQTNGHDDDPK